MLTTIAAPAALQAPPPAHEVHAPPRPPAAHPFAELLRQNRAPATPPAPVQMPAENQDERRAETPEAAAEGKASEAQKTKARNAATPAEKRAGKGERTDKDEAAATGSKPAGHDADGSGATADPALVQWLADLHLPPAVKSTAESARGDTADAGADGVADAAGRKAPKVDAAAADPRATADAKDAPGRVASDAAADLRPDQLSVIATESPHAGHAGEPGASRAEPGAHATGIAAQAFQPSAASGAAPAPLDVNLATPTYAPDFAHALGAQVSLLAKDGVQRAQLHLNPAEMGPVSVQIVMDGTQARVDFGADSAATRQAIEAGLPELAGALRDAGLTLSGGGVSQHSHGRDSDGAGSGAGARAGGHGRHAESEPVQTVGRRTTVAGGVDLYA